MDILLVPFLKILLMVLLGFRWSLILYAVLSWLIAFNMLNMQSLMVYRFNDMLRRIIEPVLRPIRSFMPSMGGVDLSFLVLFFGVTFLEGVVERIALRFMMGL